LFLKRLRNRAIATLTILTLLFVPLLSSNVIAKPLEKKPFLLEDATEKTKTEFTKKIMQSNNFQELNKKYNFDHNGIDVKKFPKVYDEVIAVYIPIKDNTGYNYSKYIEFYDKNGSLKDSFLFACHKQDNNIYHVSMQTNGSKAEADITEKGEIVGGTVIDSYGISRDLSSIVSSKAEGAGITTLLSIKEASADTCSMFWSCLNNCLASMGIASWALTALSIACGFLCVCTAGTGCIVCLGASAIVATNILNYCIAMCW